MPLKREPGPTIAYIGAVRLWLDDIERLVIELSNDGKNDVKIEADGYTAETVDDLAELPHHAIRELHLRQYFDGMLGHLIMIDRSIFTGARIFIGVADDAGLGALTRLKAELNRRRRLIGGWVNVYVASFAATIAAVIAAALVIRAMFAPIDSVGGRVLATTVAIAVCVLVYVGTGSLARSLIYTARRAERPSWWRRNRDHLTVGLITGVGGAILGGALGAVLTYYLTRP